MTDELLTSEEAIEKLGIPRSTFFTKVKKGEIVKELPAGRERGARYRIVTSNEKRLSTKDALENMVFRRALPEDAQGMYELGESIMSKQGGYGIRAEKLRPLLEIPNSEIGHVLIKDGRIIGYFTIVPLKHKQIMQKMKREINIVDIPVDELPNFEPGIPIDCFMWEIMSDPREKGIGQYLISKILKFFHALGKRGVEIEGIYAVGSSIEGISLARRLGMKLMNLPKEPRYMPFELKIQENKNWITKDYILALESYKRRENKLKRNALSLLELEEQNK